MLPKILGGWQRSLKIFLLLDTTIVYISEEDCKIECEISCVSVAKEMWNLQYALIGVAIIKTTRSSSFVKE